LRSWVQALVLPAQACDARVLQFFLGAKVVLSQLNSKFFKVFLLVFATDFQPIPLEIGFYYGSPTGLECLNKHSKSGFRRGVNPTCPADSMGKVWCLVSKTNCKRSFAAVV
jgi:hypothetical protein